MSNKGKTTEADERYTGKRDETYISLHRRGRPFIKKGGEAHLHRYLA